MLGSFKVPYHVIAVVADEIDAAFANRDRRGIFRRRKRLQLKPVLVRPNAAKLIAAELPVTTARHLYHRASFTSLDIAPRAGKRCVLFGGGAGLSRLAVAGTHR